VTSDRAAPVAAEAVQARRRAKRRRRGVVTAALSLAGHLGLIAALVWAPRPPTPMAEPTPIAVALVPGPPAVSPEPPAPSPPSPAPPPPRELARPTRAPPDVPPLPAGEGKAEGEGVELSDAQLASATPAGSGGGGRPCDMAQRLQAALRKDARIQAAVAEARGQTSAGKPLFVWNGDWIRSRGQEGAGLAAVREAIMWEVAFAPEACRAEPVHGLVLLSMNDGAGSAGLVMGQGVWRWSDLLRPRPAG